MTRWEIEKGREFDVEFTEQENDDHEAPQSHGHFHIEIGFGAGEWWAFAEHWDLESQVIIETPPAVLPEWNQINWNDWKSPVSKYFTVGEVTNMSRARIPKNDRDPVTGATLSETLVKQNIVKVARRLDDIRDAWGPIGVNSWLRPWPINRRIGSRSSNHPQGSGVDIRCLRGDTIGLERMIERDYYNAGKWDGGLGRGARRRGFVHLDLNPEYGRRVWNY